MHRSDHPARCSVMTLLLLTFILVIDSAIYVFIVNFRINFSFRDASSQKIDIYTGWLLLLKDFDFG